MESTKEGETLCLANHSLERYNWTLKSIVGSHPSLLLFTGSLIGQEVDSSQVHMPGAPGMDITVN